MSIAAAPAKRERIEARATAESKALIEHAAAISGLSVSDFLVQSAEDRAVEIIERRSRVRLSVERSIAFAEAANCSTPPSDDAISLANDYWAWVSNVERS